MTSNHFILRECPIGFVPNVIAAGCCVTCEDKILFLKRHPEKAQGNMWGVPGGKMEPDEEIRDCVIREVFEEAGVDIDDPALRYMGALYCRVPEGIQTFEYVFHLYHKSFASFPALNIELKEHTEGTWVTLEEAYALPLMLGGREVVDFYAEMISAFNKLRMLKC